MEYSVHAHANVQSEYNLSAESNKNVEFTGRTAESKRGKCAELNICHDVVFIQSV